MIRVLKVFWLIVSIVLIILIIIKMIDIGVTYKYEVEEPLMNGVNDLLLEKSRLIKTQLVIMKVFLSYLFVNVVLLILTGFKKNSKSHSSDNK